MDWYPLYNSLRIALISTVIIFFAGLRRPITLRVCRACSKVCWMCCSRCRSCCRLRWSAICCCACSDRKEPSAHGRSRIFNLKLTMVWWSAIFATAVVIFPLMYRTARGAFESFDETLADAGRTLGRSNTWIFWRVRMPCCRQGILAGTVLAFARALGEYGATSMVAGYTPGRTATISTTVYQLWRTNDDALAFKWVVVNLAISAVVLLAVNLLEKRERGVRKAWH